MIVAVEEETPRRCRRVGVVTAARGGGGRVVNAVVELRRSMFHIHSQVYIVLYHSCKGEATQVECDPEIFHTLFSWVF